MLPLQPPLPTAWNLPFQPEAGIQTSILMSESADGLSVAATRQNAGRSLNDGGEPLAGIKPGKLKAPAATGSARVMVVSGRGREARLWQVAARAGTARAAPASSIVREVMCYSSTGSIR